MFLNLQDQIQIFSINILILNTNIVLLSVSLFQPVQKFRHGLGRAQAWRIVAWHKTLNQAWAWRLEFSADSGRAQAWLGVLLRD